MKQTIPLSLVASASAVLVSAALGLLRLEREPGAGVRTNSPGPASASIPIPRALFDMPPDRYMSPEADTGRPWTGGRHA